MERAERYGGGAPFAVFRPEAPRSFSWISDLLFVATSDKGEIQVTPSECIFCPVQVD